MALYRTSRNEMLLRTLLSGPVTTHVLSGMEQHQMRAFVGLRLAERLYTGQRGVKTYGISTAGRALAREWSIVVARYGECCEAAILGIEGDHDPYPVCTRVGGVPVEASGSR